MKRSVITPLLMAFLLVGLTSTANAQQRDYCFDDGFNFGDITVTQTPPEAPVNGAIFIWDGDVGGDWWTISDGVYANKNLEVLADNPNPDGCQAVVDGLIFDLNRTGSSTLEGDIHQVCGGQIVFTFTGVAMSGSRGSCDLRTPGTSNGNGGFGSLIANKRGGPQGVSPFQAARGEAMDIEDLMPSQFALSQNFPNPFNPTTQIEFSLLNDAQVRLTVYNLLGQEIRTLVSSEKAAGTHQVTWNGQNNAGAAVPSGVYIYRLEAGDLSITKRMTLLK